MKVELEIHPDVWLFGQYTPASKATRHTPGTDSFVDVTSLRIQGIPDRILEWVWEQGPSEFQFSSKLWRANFMEGLAEELLVAHEETMDPSPDDQ